MERGFYARAMVKRTVTSRAGGRRSKMKPRTKREYLRRLVEGEYGFPYAYR